jgi:hypothetical protein
VPFLPSVSVVGDQGASVVTTGFGCRCAWPQPVAPPCGCWSTVGRHGIAWAELGSQRGLTLYCGIRSIISRLRQTLTGSFPIHPKPILYHKNIRVSFLWTTLWKFAGRQPGRWINGPPGGHHPGNASRGTPAGERQPANDVELLGKKCQTACKPGSVRPLTRRDDHSSGTHLAMRLTRPTRAAGRECPCNNHVFCNRDVAAAPIRSCSRWGLPCRPCCQERGALLPHRFALARGTSLLAQAGLARAVCFLWHCPWGRPRRPLAGTVFPWSPDFPPHAELLCIQRPSSCLAPRGVRPRAQAVKRSEATNGPRWPTQRCA